MSNKPYYPSNSYDDLYDLPRHESTHRSKMSVRDRAAQFSPFSAVVGHDTAVKEAARHTVQKKELDETQKISINECLNEIEMLLPEKVFVEVLYFQVDGLKTGGNYQTLIGQVKKILIYEGMLLMVDGLKISIEDIYDLSIRDNLL